VRPYRDAPDRFRIPELVRLLHPRGGPGDVLDRLVERKTPTEGGARGEEQVRELVVQGLSALAELLGRAAFLFEYRLGVARQGVLESWMGVPRPRRPVIASRAELADGQPVLVDGVGRLVVSLHPLVQVARPAPGHEEEMFLLESGSPGGALLVSLPVGYERHDEGLWSWFGESLLSGTGDQLVRVTIDDLPPYRGLASFTREDADRFFGRERRIESVVNRLRVEPLLAIVGPSGAGKTSFVQAGVVPRLPRGWWALTARPGRAPIASLETALRGAGVALPATSRPSWRTTRTPSPPPCAPPAASAGPSSSAWSSSRSCSPCAPTPTSSAATSRASPAPPETATIRCGSSSPCATTSWCAPSRRPPCAIA
jgi:hypothetical protein